MTEPRIAPRTFRPADADAITGVDAEKQRDWRRRGYMKGGRTGWTEYKLKEIVALLFVNLLISAKFLPQHAWDLASDEVLGTIIFHAARVPGALIDKTKSKILKSHKTYINKAAMDLTGRPAVGGPIFAWGPSLHPNCYATFDQAQSLAEGSGPHVITTIDLREVGKHLVERAGSLGTVEDRN